MLVQYPKNPEGDDKENVEWYFGDGEGSLDDFDPDEFWYSDAKSFSSGERDSAIWSTATNMVFDRSGNKKKS